MMTECLIILSQTKNSAGIVTAEKPCCACTAVQLYQPTQPNLPAQDNVNPIERAELSSLAMASCIHGVAPLEMAAPAHYDAVRLMMGPSLPDPS